MGATRSRPAGTGATGDSLSDGENGSILTAGLSNFQRGSGQSPISPQNSILWKQNNHVRQASVRSRSTQPMPDPGELDRRFAKVLSDEYAVQRKVVEIELKRLDDSYESDSHSNSDEESSSLSD